MKKLIEKIGLDKITHFSLGGLICSLLTFIVMLQEGNQVGWWCLSMPTIGTVIVFILSYIKEKVIDDKFNWKDILASILGCATVYLSVGIGTLFNILSK